MVYERKGLVKNLDNLVFRFVNFWTEYAKFNASGRKMKDITKSSDASDRYVGK